MEACGKMSGLREDAFLEKAEIAKCLRKLKNNKTGGSDGLVGELLKHDAWFWNGLLVRAVIVSCLA